MAWEVERPPKKEKTPTPADVPAKKTAFVSLECAYCHNRFSFELPYTQKNNKEIYAKYCPEHRESKNRPKGKSKRKCPNPGKKAIGNQYDAQAFALKVSRSYGKPVRAYHCICGSWHITVHRAKNMGQ